MCSLEVCTGSFRTVNTNLRLRSMKDQNIFALERRGNLPGIIYRQALCPAERIPLRRKSFEYLLFITAGYGGRSYDEG